MPTLAMLTIEEKLDLRFSIMPKIDNVGILPTVRFPYNCSFHFYLHHIMLLYVNLDISWYKSTHFKLADFIDLVNF